MARLTTTMMVTGTSVGAPDSGAGVAYYYQWASVDGAFAGAGLVVLTTQPLGPQDVRTKLIRLIAADINDSGALGDDTVSERNILIV